MLILIVIAIAVVGFQCALRIRAALNAVQNSQDMSLANFYGDRSSVALQLASVNNQAVSAGLQLKRQILGSCAAVFLSFLLRACYNTMVALIQAASNIDAPCEPYINRCNAACYNIYSHMLVWNFFTPELYFSVSFFSHPLTMITVLWGMTSGQSLRILMASS
jgi:hypothetical protein